MQQFKDSSGRNWTLAMTIDSVKRVRDLLGINLLEPEAGDPPILVQLGKDDLKMIDVIYCILKPDLDAAHISDEGFGKSLGGDVILSAVNAFYEELADFFQKRGRIDRARAVETQQKVINLAIQRVEQELSRIDPARALDETVGK